MRRLLCGWIVIALVCSLVAGHVPAAKAAGTLGDAESIWHVGAYIPGAHGTVTPAAFIAAAGTATLGLSPFTVASTGTVIIPVTIDIMNGTIGVMQLTVSSSDPTHVALTNITAGDLGGWYSLIASGNVIGWMDIYLSGITGFHTLAYLTFSGTGAPGSTATISVGDSSPDYIKDDNFDSLHWSPETVLASVALNSWVITPSAGSNGSISPETLQTVAEGATPTFTMTPATGYDVADVLVDGVSIGAATTYTFPPVTANHTIAASFSATPLATPGDIDGNGTVTMLDALLAARAAVGITVYTPGSSAFLAADVNHDGVITMMDVLLIARIAVGISG
jgi:hypothetical protein